MAAVGGGGGRRGRVWLAGVDDVVVRRIDDGRHEFCFDPVLSPDGHMASWIGWSPPWMAWDAAERVDVFFRGSDDADLVSTWKPDDGAVSEPRFAPDGMPTHIHDGSGWRNVYVGGRPVRPESLEHAGATLGDGATVRTTWVPMVVP